MSDVLLNPFTTPAAVLTTAYASNGTITETLEGGVTRVTTFTANTQVVVYSGAISRTVTTTYHANGTSTEAIT